MNVRPNRFAFSTLLVSASLISCDGALAAPPARVCIAPVSVQMAGISNDDAVAALRERLTTFLAGPSVKVEALSARLEAHARDEARQKKCGFVFFTSVNQERRTRGTGGMLGRLTSGAIEGGANHVAVRGDSVATRVLASAAAGSVHNVDFGLATQSSDKLTLDARLENIDGTQLSQTKETRKAKSDGEDLLTPLIERAASTAVNVINSNGK